jgi:hypothetical protein
VEEERPDVADDPAILGDSPRGSKRGKTNEHYSSILAQHRGLVGFTGNRVEPERDEAPSLHLTRSARYPMEYISVSRIRLGRELRG